MSIEQNNIYQTTDCNDGMNPLHYYDRNEIASRLNTIFNRYMASETNIDEMKKNHWLIACVCDHFLGINRRDELLSDDTEAV